VAVAVAEVEIEEPDPGWPGEFGRVGDEVRALLGKRARRIDHIGSTAVPGLAAKNVIDVQVSVADEPAMDAATSRLAEAGWRVWPERCADHVAPGAVADRREWVKRFAQEPPDRRRVNLHVRIEGRANQRYAVLVRDYLRAHEAVAAAYGIFKRGAAALLPDDLDTYADLKDPVCDLVYLPAEDWAARTGWTPGPSDA
jgi:dephospho-CoA kinase